MIQLVRTNYRYPEQYDAYLDGRQVGYLRLRNGGFTVDFPDCEGETIYEASPRGDGRFEDDERDCHLRLAVGAILKKLKRNSEIMRASPAPNDDYEIVSSTK
jgi:hypothetical protein